MLTPRFFAPAMRGAPRIIHRAFVREVLHTCGAVSVILLAIFLVARVMGFLRQAVEGDIPADSVLLLLLLKTLTYLDILAPLVVYISMLLVMGRWIRDNELTVISACGIGINQFLRPALTLLAVVGGMVALFSLYLSPLATQAARVVSSELRHRADVSGVIPGVFTETRDGRLVYFVESYDAHSGAFGGIFVYDGSGAEDSVLLADSARLTTDDETAADFLVLTNGARYRATAGDPGLGVLDFETYQLRIEPPAPATRTLPLGALSTPALLAENRAAATGEFHWRLSKIAMLPVLMIFALAFSAVTYRKTRFPGMLAALLVYFAYSNLLGLGVALIRRGIAHPHLGLWAVHLLFLGLAVFFLHRRNHNLPLLPGRAA